MTLFMMWMTGSGVNIFNIMITLYTVANPLKAIVSVRSGTCSLTRRAHTEASRFRLTRKRKRNRHCNATHAEFARFAELGGELLLPQLVFVAINLLTFGLGAYKAYNLGLLPTDADWAMGLSPKQVPLTNATPIRVMCLPWMNPRGCHRPLIHPLLLLSSSPGVGLLGRWLHLLAPAAPPPPAASSPLCLFCALFIVSIPSLWIDKASSFPFVFPRRGG